jgi:drug/metabolite transporter superfamily protein YnfA
MENLIGIVICLALIFLNIIGLITFKKSQFKEKTYKALGLIFLILNLIMILALAKLA